MNVLTTLRSRREDEPAAHCPNDDWEFAPRYTDGVCPICGWRPPGVRVEPPLAGRLDWFWPAIVFVAIASIAMAIAVVVVYVRA